MKETAYSILFAAVLLGITSIPCFAADGWQANLLVSSGNASSKLTFGQNPAATDLDDGFYDVPAMFSGDLRAAFTDGGGTLWRDIRAAGNETAKEWRLTVTSGTEESIRVSWDRKGLPKDAMVALIDVETGESIDMKVSSNYALGNRNGAELLIVMSSSH